MICKRVNYFLYLCFCLKSGTELNMFGSSLNYISNESFLFLKEKYFSYEKCWKLLYENLLALYKLLLVQPSSLSLLYY